MKNYHSRFFGCIIINLIFMVTVFSLRPGIIKAQSNYAVDNQVEKAILAEDWSKVTELLDSINTETPSPILRLIKGHACLALNRNNESFCLFLSVSSDQDLKQWQKWSEDFTVNHPNSHMAHFLQGDALSRFENWGGALSHFGRALEIEPNHPIVLNARGVVYAHQNAFAKARVDLADAIEYSGSTLADTYANIGALRIQKRDGPTGALRAFNKALELSPEFFLALHDRGCVQLVLGRMDEADKDFRRAQEQSSCVPGSEILTHNRLRIEAYWKGLTENELIAMLDSGEEAGTTFDSRVTDVQHEWNNFMQGHGRLGGQFKLNRFHEKFGALTPSQQEAFFKNHMAPALKNDPSLLKHYNQGLGNIGTHNKFAAKSWEDSFKIGGGAIAGAGLGHGNLPAAGAGAGIFSLGSKFGQWREHNLKSYDSQIRLQDQFLGNPMSGGADLSLDKTLWDHGQWPFIAYYALNYGKGEKGLPLDRTGQNYTAEVREKSR